MRQKNQRKKQQRQRTQAQARQPQQLQAPQPQRTQEQQTQHLQQAPQVQAEQAQVQQVQARRQPHPHPQPPTGTARGHFPSRPAARLAGLTDRAGHLADRLAPRASAERVLDLTLGTALLIATAPAVALGALTLAVRRGPGNVWERTPRTGLGGRVFTLRSLRTRRLRLDLLSRLPQVVRGDLSLVGPAPLAPGDPRAAWPGARQWRQELRPGLTGLAQVRARSGMPWDDPALLDQHYAEHHGVVLDLVILTEAVRNSLRTTTGRARSTKAHLSDTDHRLPGYSRVD
ncbi:sugar transferase [Streptomyces microflavus]|uniref:sugar transferase n=1 Tax=Streptomyces microflavus TaxID=1919 RepID=UPI00380500FA